MRKKRRKTKRRMGSKNSRERGRGNFSMRRRNRETVHDCITKFQHFSLISKQKVSWKLEQNITAIIILQPKPSNSLCLSQNETEEDGLTNSF